MNRSIYRDVFWGFVKKNGEIIEIFEIRGEQKKVDDYVFEFNPFKPLDFLGVRKNSRTYGVRYCGYCGKAYYITDGEKCPVCGRRVRKKKYRNM